MDHILPLWRHSFGLQSKVLLRGLRRIRSFPQDVEKTELWIMLPDRPEMFPGVLVMGLVAVSLVPEIMLMVDVSRVVNWVKAEDVMVVGVEVVTGADAVVTT